MTESELQQIVRLEAWVRDFGDQKPEPFISDLKLAIALARKSHDDDVRAQKAVEDFTELHNGLEFDL